MTFYNRQHKYYISTNTKVLSSSLRKQISLVVANRKRELANMLLKHTLPAAAKPHYLLVRNPYKRVESFFKEKLRKCVLQATGNPPYRLKLHQEIFYPFLGITTADSVVDIQRKLLGMSFAQFVQLLPSVYLLDSHLRPQSMILRQSVQKLVAIPFRYDRFFKIDDARDMDFLSSDLHLDMNIRVNASKDNRNEILWTEKELRIVNGLYRKDFEFFGYSVRQTSDVQ